jgi:hypothetical protein
MVTGGFLVDLHLTKMNVGPGFRRPRLPWGGSTVNEEAPITELAGDSETMVY